MSHRRMWLMSSAFVGLAMGSHAHAATAPQTTGASAGTSISEVVVTAEKRDTNVQKTPISIQVYSGAELVSRGVDNIRSLSTIDTSININASGGYNTVSVRGVSNSNATETGEPAVQIATDGIFNDRAYSLSATLYDLARIEVLRGPQGTLFGRNTTGGIVSIITQHPTMTNSGSVTADLGNHGTHNFMGFLNLVAADTFQARFAFSTRNHDGYRHDTLSSMRGDDEDSQSGRLEVAWEPITHLKTWASFSYTEEEGVGPVSELRPFTYPAGTPSPVPTGTEPAHVLSPLLSDGINFPVLAPTSQDIKTTDVKWNASYDDLPWGTTLTYLGGYDRIHYIRGLSASGAIPFLFTRREYPETFNNELRLSSPSGGRWVWQVGFYSFIENSHLFTDAQLFPGTARQLLYYYFNTPKIHADSEAVFGQTSYNLTSRLKITAGARYTSDSKSRQGDQVLGPGAGHAVPLTLTGNQDGSTSSNRVTYTVGADYSLTPENLVYAKVSTGYKAGGFTASNQYAPENVIAYEAGSKNQFFDNHLQANLAAYLMNYTNQQVNQYLSINGLPAAATIVNAGRSRIYGLEANAIALLGPVGRLDLSANLLHARYEDYNAVQFWNNKNRQLAGNTLPVSPNFTLAAHLERDFAGPAGSHILARIGGKYTSNQYFDPFNFPDERQPAYFIGDGSVTISPANSKFSVQVYAENIGDKKYFTFADEQSGVGYAYSYGAPRTYGVRLTAGF